MHEDTNTVARRGFLLGTLSMALAACSTTSPSAVPSVARRPMGVPSEEELAARYAAMEDGGHQLPAVPFRQIDPKFYRQRVVNTTGEPAGTVVVDTGSKFLYVVEPGGTAMRYGVGLGRAGFAWEGEGVIQWRQKWPRWKPPAEMIARQPELAKFSVENGGRSPGRTMRSAPARSTSSRTARTRFTVCTERVSGTLSGNPCPPAACGWSIRMSSTSTRACLPRHALSSAPRSCGW